MGLLDKILGKEKKSPIDDILSGSPNDIVKNVTQQDDILSSLREDDNIISNIGCPHDYAARFKKAVEDNQGGLAADILIQWPSDDANRKYGFIIFDGTPPSNVSYAELQSWLTTADSMTPCDPSLKPWFRETAIMVMNLHK